MDQEEINFREKYKSVLARALESGLISEEDYNDPKMCQEYINGYLWQLQIHDNAKRIQVFAVFIGVSLEAFLTVVFSKYQWIYRGLAETTSEYVENNTQLIQLWAIQLTEFINEFKTESAEITTTGAGAVSGFIISTLAQLFGNAIDHVFGEDNGSINASGLNKSFKTILMHLRRWMQGQGSFDPSGENDPEQEEGSVTDAIGNLIDTLRVFSSKSNWGRQTTQ
jgi:hypothetical protein